jgi:hypothetical protein
MLLSFEDESFLFFDFFLFFDSFEELSFSEFFRFLPFLLSVISSSEVLFSCELSLLLINSFSFIFFLYF